MNILKVTSKFNSVFLAVILVAGTIVAFSPSFMTADAQSESYYGMDKDRKSYGKDVNVKSIKCNNVNVNINGLELNVLPPALSTLLTGGEADDNAYSYGSGERNYGSESSGSETDFRFICINNNNNTVVGVDNGTTPIQPEPITCEECFTENLTVGQLNSLLSFLAILNFENLEGLCEFLSDSTTSNANKLVVLVSLLSGIEGITEENFDSVVDCLEELGLIIVPPDFELPIPQP